MPFEESSGRIGHQSGMKNRWTGVPRTVRLDAEVDSVPHPLAGRAEGRTRGKVVRRGLDSGVRPVRRSSYVEQEPRDDYCRNAGRDGPLKAAF